jgi:hypothetical protein
LYVIYFDYSFFNQAYMKGIIVILICLTSLILFGQTAKTEFDGRNWDAPYNLAFPKGWEVERFLIPIEFAPSIPYKGVEDIRFAPGWGNPKSEEYWSYAFLWYLDSKPKLTEINIAGNLEAYYTGLIGRNIAPRKIPAEKVFPVKTTIKQVATKPGDIQTFTGNIYMLDYMEQKPITLNCIVHVKYCADKVNAFIFTEISPKIPASKIWDSLDKLWTEFQCDKTATGK